MNSDERTPHDAMTTMIQSMIPDTECSYCNGIGRLPGCSFKES